MKLTAIILTILLLFTACAAPAANTAQTTAAQTSETASAMSAMPTESLTDVEAASIVQQSLDTKLKAIEENDLALYLCTITAQDAYFYNEQRRWFDEMTDPGIKDLSFEIVEVQVLDSENIAATINQKHYYYEPFDFEYELLYRLEDGEWKDCGYNFLVKEYDLFTLKYQPGEERVDEFAALIEKSYGTITSQFDMRIDSHIEIKMFHDRELLRQTTIPTIRRQFTGWGEANESLKFYSGFPVIDRYYSVFLHEFTHHVTLKMCNNNLPAWFAEGLAVSYGTYVARNGNSLENEEIDKEAIKVDIPWLEDFDAVGETDQALIDSWYYGSGMFVEFLRDTYGEQAMTDMLYKAGEKPYNENIFNEQYEEQNRETLLEVFDSVLGKTPEELTSEYFQWLDENY